MRFAVLGPLSVWNESTPVVVNSAKQRLLLALLLAHQPHPVSADALADALWSHRPPREHRKRLAWHVASLRDTLGDRDRITWDSRGYAIRLADGELDVAEFETRCSNASGNDEQIADLLGQALRLWRGAAYADLADCPVLRTEANRLAELRLAALERRIDAELRLGRHDRLIPELTTLVDEHPHRETFGCQLMLALYRCGRQADALEVYRGCRERLTEDLGIEPGPRLRQLHQAVLRNDDELDAPPAAASAPAPAELPAGVPTFTGRAAELDRLRDLLLAEGQSPVVISAISGAAGVGKSALAVRVARDIAGSFPDGQLYANLQGATPNVAPVLPADVLRRLLRSLGGDPPSVATVDELAARFRSTVAGKRLLLILDDAHDAAQVRPLLPGGPGCAVVITSRQNLAALDGVSRCRIDVLPHEDAVALFTRLTPERGDTAEPTVARIAALCGGVPMALCIAAARLTADPDLKPGDLADQLAADSERLVALDDGERAVRSSFLGSYRNLTTTHPDASRLYRLLGLHDGADISLAVAAALFDRPEADTRAAFDVLNAAHLIEEPEPGRYRCHDLLRLFARERVTEDETEPERTAALRRMRHSYLATARDALRTVRPGDDHSARLSLTPKSLVVSGVATPTREAAYHWVRQEIDNLIAVLRMPHGESHDVLTYNCALAAVLNTVLLDIGDLLKLREVCDLTPQMADRAGSLAVRYLIHVDATESSSLLGDLDLASDRGHKALAIAEQAGNERWTAMALSRLSRVVSRQGRHEATIEYAKRILEIGERIGFQTSVTFAQVALGNTYTELNRYDEAATALRAAAESARRDGHQHNEAIATGNLAEVLHKAGKTAEAAAVLEQTLLLYRDAALSETLNEAEHLWRLGDIRYDLGEIERARACWRRSAGTLLRLGRIDEATKNAIETATRPEVPRAFLL